MTRRSIELPAEHEHTAGPLIFGGAVIVFAILVSSFFAWWHWPALVACEADSAFRCVVELIRGLGGWGVAMSLAAMVLAALTMFPSEAAAMANGAVYGAVWGTVLTWAGAMIGANIAYAAARGVGPLAIGLLLSEDHYRRICAWTDRSGHLAILAARLVPLFPYFAVNYAAGLIGMRWWPFNWISAIGTPPAALVFTAMGAKAGEVAWVTWASMAAGIVLALLLVARALRRRAAV